MENGNEKPTMLKKILEHGFVFNKIEGTHENLLSCLQKDFLKAIPIDVDFYLPAKVFANKKIHDRDNVPFRPPILNHPFWVEYFNTGYLCTSFKDDPGTIAWVFTYNSQHQPMLISRFYVKETMDEANPMTGEVHMIIGAEKELQLFGQLVGKFSGILLALYKLLNAKNIFLKEAESFKIHIHPSLKNHKNHKKKEVKFYFLSVIDGSIVKTVNDEAVDKILPEKFYSKGLSTRLLREHYVRGHWAHYMSEKPMFGRLDLFGWFWRDGHLRGDENNGVIEKGYRVE